MELTSKPVKDTKEETASESAASVNKDDSMDISALLKQSKEEAVVEKTPLQRMQERQAEQGVGLVIDNEELKKANEPKTLKQSKSIDDAEHDTEAYLEDADKLIEASKTLKFSKPIQNAVDFAMAMDAVNKVANGESIEDNEYVTTMTEGELAKRDERIEAIASGNEDPGVESEGEGEEKPAPTEADVKRQELVTVLIDKTGLGGEFHFTEEEQEKIVNATQIKLTEVEDIDLSTITVRKSDKSFLDSVDEYQLSSSRVPVVFPASRFRAYMTGLTYGEMGDLSLNTENITFDQLHKKLSIIYNKMVNPSIGKFDGFEDFLKKFSYLDIDLATYGLVVASFPEVSEIQLSCNKEKCKKSYNYKFSPRTLLRFENCGQKFLDATKEVVDCDAVDAKKLAETSPVTSHKRIKLPYSGFIIEIGVASAYEYLYSIVQNVAGGKFKEKFPEDINGILELNAALLSCIRSVLVPDGKGSYVQYEDFEDMIRALYMIKSEEFALVVKYLQAYTENYKVSFQLTNIVCPHCGAKTPQLALNIDYMLFLRYQRLMSTELDLENVTVL